MNCESRVSFLFLGMANSYRYLSVNLDPDDHWFDCRWLYWFIAKALSATICLKMSFVSRCDSKHKLLGIYLFHYIGSIDSTKNKENDG